MRPNLIQPIIREMIAIERTCSILYGGGSVRILTDRRILLLEIPVRDPIGMVPGRDHM